MFMYRGVTRDERFIDLALKAKLLTPDQLEDCENLRRVLSRNDFSITLPEIAIRKEFLNADQVRMVNVAIRYEESREFDLNLGAFIVRKGFLPRERVEECLSLQEISHKDGRHFPRLQDLLVQKSYLSPQQVHVILRAWEQLGSATEAKGQPGSSPYVPQLQPSLPPPEPPPRAKPVRQDRRSLEGGLSLVNLKVAARRAKLREVLAGAPITILDVDGAIDAHTAPRFDEFLDAAISSQNVRLVMNCDALMFVSSAGIGVITGAAKRCRDLNGDLRLCNVREPVRKVIDMLGLQSILRIYDGERAAAVSFKYG